MDELNIVLAAVGGQGVLLMAEILGSAAIKDGYDVRISEIHGMAQRGGAVACHVRIGKDIHSPTVLEGTADVIVGVDPAEALRNVAFASSRTLVLLNSQIIVPPVVFLGKSSRPRMESIVKQFHSITKKVIVIGADGLARKAGSAVTQNVVMLGALAAAQGSLPRLKTLRSAIRELVPPKYMKMNLRSFQLGYNAIAKFEKSK